MKLRWYLCSSAALCAITLVSIARAQVGAPAPSLPHPDALPGGIAQQAYLKASNTQVEDYFGWSVAVSGDTVVVGAYGEDSEATGVNGDGTNNSALNAGAAYVFVRSGAAWNQQAYLKASNTEASDLFGFSVSISGDTIVIGAPGEDSNATGVDGDRSNNGAINSGAAYVFVRSGRTWSQQAYLKASNTGAGDRFGWSVSVYDDTVIVGAPSEDNSGAAYVFVRSGTTWSQQAYLKASNTRAFSGEFGHSVSVSGDTIVVGDRWEDSNATGVDGDQGNNSTIDSGAAYVFVRSGTTWSQQAYLKASNTGADDWFGYSVSVFDDTVVVGACLEASNAMGVNGDQSDNSALWSGAAYVFVRSETTWSQQASRSTGTTASATASPSTRTPTPTGTWTGVTSGTTTPSMSGGGTWPASARATRARRRSSSTTLPGSMGGAAAPTLTCSCSVTETGPTPPRPTACSNRVPTTARTGGRT